MAHKEDDPNDPSVRSEAYKFMLPRWMQINDLLGGTRAMREAGSKHLPRHSHEAEDSYQERLSTATLYNMTKITLATWVGKPFSDKVGLNPDVPPQVRTLLDDVDLCGNNVDVFARDWFSDAMAKGFSHAMVDFPAMEEDKKTRTKADDLDENRRPYWLHVKPENLISAFSEVVNGKETLTQVRIHQVITERIGFIERFTQEIKVIEPGVWYTYRLKKDKNRKEVWTKVAEGTYDLDFIPLVTFYAHRTGFMLADPPLEDLGYLNIRHWQSTADQVNILTVARFPMLAVAGGTDFDGETMAIGPRQLLGTKNENGKFYYVEHSGKAIASGLADLKDIEELMAAYGAEFLKKKPTNQTATARTLDSAEAMSPLQDAVIRFNDAMNMILYITAQWMGLESGGTVLIRTDWDDEDLDVTLRALNDMRERGDLSLEDFSNELIRRKILREDFSIEENVSRISRELALPTEVALKLKQMIADTLKVAEETKHVGDPTAPVKVPVAA